VSYNVVGLKQISSYLGGWMQTKTMRTTALRNAVAVFVRTTIRIRQTCVSNLRSYEIVLGHFGAFGFAKKN
jgi:hypothetical protein